MVDRGQLVGYHWPPVVLVGGAVLVVVVNHVLTAGAVGSRAAGAVTAIFVVSLVAAFVIDATGGGS